MRPFDNSDLAPQDRFREIAALLAVGVLRLRAQAAALDQHSTPENPEKTGNSCLELSAKTVLSVHTG